MKKEKKNLKDKDSRSKNKEEEHKTEVINNNNNNLGKIQARPIADEMEESILQGSSLGPLLVKKENMELMDGYTRYTILKKHKQKRTYVYLGSIEK